MRLAGNTWAIEEQPNPRGENVNAENAVSCSGASACTVVGSWLTRELETRPLAEGWNGTAWVRQWPPHPRSAYSASLEAVSCSSSANCAAVGGWSPSSQGIPAFALAEGWDGVSWRLEPAADPSGAQLTTLRAVNCPARCVAVGSYYNGSITQTLVERSH